MRESATRARLLQALRRDGPFHVGVLLENVPDHVFLLGAAALAGAVVVGINPTRRGRELAHDIRHTDCQLIVTEERQVGLLDGLDLGVEPERILVVESDRWADPLGEQAGARLPADLPDPDALYVLIFTSGSTGAPKAVRATQGRIAEMTQTRFGRDDVLYCAMPLFHGNALVANLMPGIGAGATIVLRRTFSASGFLPDIRSYGVTYFNTIGRALSYILATPPSPNDRDHRVRYGLAPESSPCDIAEFDARFGIPIVEGYGSSEGPIRLLPVPGTRPGALGRPEAGADVAVVDPETGQECPPAQFDGDGRLLNAGDALGEIVRRDAGTRFEGYYKNTEATAARLRNGWYWSGDLAYRDGEGTFYFAGRSIDWLRVDGLPRRATRSPDEVVAEVPADHAFAAGHRDGQGGQAEPAGLGLADLGPRVVATGAGSTLCPVRPRRRRRPRRDVRGARPRQPAPGWMTGPAALQSLIGRLDGVHPARRHRASSGMALSFSP